MGIKEIAEIAGVSKTTVSLALNGHKGISLATRRKIIEIAHQQNYRVPSDRIVPVPNKGTIIFARLYRHGLLLNSDQNPFIIDYIDGINSVVQQSDYSFEILDYHMENPQLFIETMKKRQPAGIIVLGTELDPSQIEQLNILSSPYIVMDTYFDEIPCDYVNMSNISVVYKIVEYLKDLNHRTIFMVTSSIPSGNILMRERGFIHAAERAALPFDEESLIRVKPGFQGAYEGMKAFLHSGRALPEGLFCYNDVAAFGVIKALKEQGIKVPEDISIVGFDNLPMSIMMEPHLSTVKIPNSQIGRTAAEKLIEKIGQKKENNPTVTLISGQLIKRDSVTRR
ncbi:MAG: LacI family DNA-binding transcriptional regulator [Sphaerochaetaceae bacterium]